MKPEFITKKGKTKFIDNTGREWDTEHLQELIDIGKKIMEAKDLLEYYF